MAVVAVVDGGWIIDHQNCIDNAYASTMEFTPSAISIKGASLLDACGVFHQFASVPELFDIGVEFMMDSHFDCPKSNEALSACNLKKELITNSEMATSKLLTGSEIMRTLRTKKRKRRKSLSDGEISWLENDYQVVTNINRVLTRPDVIQLISSRCVSTEKYDNNQAARKAARITGFGDVLRSQCSACIAEPKPMLNLLNTGKLQFSAEEIINRLVEYPYNEAAVAQLDENQFLLPPRCRFLLSDITQMSSLVNDDTKYDCIVIDPPWQNKSVKRKKVYDMLEDSDLFQLPVRDLSKQNTLIAVWVTNRTSHQNFVESKLFKLWSVKRWTKWYWMKVTKFGKPVTCLNATNTTKRPYETLLIGRVSGDDPAQCTVQVEAEVNGTSGIPPNAVIISVPCSIHSRKPPLADVLKPYLPEDAKCLELFARNLIPGWTSWGNEVLAHQHVNFFVELNAK